MRSNTTTLEIPFDEFKTETPMAYGVMVDDVMVWLPKSQCEIDEFEMVVEVPEWLAIEKGIEDYAS